MDEYRTKEEIELDARRPSWVAFAAILLAIGTAAQIGLVLSSIGLTLQTGIFATLMSLGFVVAYGLFTLKKWAYWVFTGLNIFSVVSFIVKFEAITMQTNLLKFIPFFISVAWVVYFLSKPVRSAFKLKW